MRYTLFSILCFFISFNAHSGWLDKVKDGYDTAKESTKETLGNAKAATEKTYTDLKTSLTEPGVSEKIADFNQELPEDWRQYYLTETHFGSSVYTLEVSPNKSETVILIHGLGANASKDWFELIPALAENYRVIAFDLPGFGRSDTPKSKLEPAAYSKVLGSLIPQVSNQPVHLIGHSMGASISLFYASEHPESVNKLILVDAAGLLEKHAYVRQLTQVPLDSVDMPDTLKSIAYFFKGKGDGYIDTIMALPDPTVLLEKSNTAWSNTLGYSPSMNAAMGLMFQDFSQPVNSYQKPVALIWGEKDKVAPMRNAHMLKAQLKSSSLNVIDGAGHNPMTSHTKIFNQLTLDLLAGTTTPEALNSKKTEALDSYHCKGDKEQLLSGHYTRIELESCKGITLENVQAGKIIIKNSTVKIINSQVLANQVAALEAKNSRVTITGGKLSGSIALFSDKSQIDLAGTTLIGTKEGLKVKGKSRIIASISRIESPIYSGPMHGMKAIKKSTLDSVATEKYSTSDLVKDTLL